jgi:outer membrane receptor protein involved in Fe transport
LKWVRESRLTFIPTLYAVPIHDTVMDKGPGAFVNLDYKGLSAAGSYMKWTSRAFQALNNLDDVKYFGNIGYKTKVSDNWQTEMNVTGVRAEIFTDDVQFIERHSNNLLFENTNFLTLAKDLNVVAGGTANYIEGREKYTFPMESGAEPYFTSSGNRWAFALYGQADYTLRNTVKLITGLQANKTRGIKEHIAPRIGAIVHPTREISIKAFYSEAFRLPSINELFMNFNVGLFGDRQLKPEVVKTTDLGVTYQIDKMMIGATFFHSKQTDIIQQTLLPGSITARRYSNLGTVNFTGVELEGKCYISERLYADASLLFQNNKDSAFGVVPYANFGAKGSLSYEHERGFTLTLSDAYQGPLDDKFNGKFNNQGNSGAFQLLNFSSQWNLGKLFALQVRLDPTILFKVDNLVGREIWMYEYGGFSNDVIPVMRGREFYIGMNLSL